MDMLLVDDSSSPDVIRK